MENLKIYERKVHEKSTTFSLNRRLINFLSKVDWYVLIMVIKGLQFKFYGHEKSWIYDLRPFLKKLKANTREN